MPARPLLTTMTLTGALSGALVLTGCGSDSTPSGSSSRVAISAGDSTCQVAKTEFGAGTIAFEVTNDGKDTTEVYVYGKGSSDAYDKIVGEVENIAPGTSRDFTVNAKAGDYEVACKPGQTGNGIRTKIEVTGEGGSTEAAYDREVEVVATDYKLEGLASFTGQAGEKIEFKLENKSASHQHELEILGPDGSVVGEVSPVDPGTTGEAVIELEKAGTYTYKCGIANHADRGMKGTFTVS